MKKLLPSIITLLAIPSLTFAAFTVPLVGTTTGGLVTPQLGNTRYIPYADYFIGTSTTIASSFPYASTTALTVNGVKGLKVGTLSGLLVGTSGQVTAVTAPSGAVVGDTDTQTLTNKTINGANNTLTVRLASDVTGNLPVTNLNSGTSAGGTTFWRGDGTWATPSGSGGGTDVNWTYFNGSGIYNSTTTGQVLIGANSTTTLANLEVRFQTAAKGSILATGSTTLQNVTWLNSTSTQATTTNLAIPSIVSAIVLTNANGSASGYAGVTCTNQFLRALSGLGASTCATVGAADVSLANLTATDGSLTFSGTYTGATARTIGINLANPNTWTGLQTINYASTTMVTATLMYKTGAVSIATTTTWTGSTTEQQLFSPIQAETWLGATCNTNVSGSTANVQFFNRGAKLDMIPASSTPAFFTFTTNNSLTALATTSYIVGTSTPMTGVTCTIKRLAPAN